MPRKRSIHPVLVLHGGASTKLIRGSRLNDVKISLRNILDHVYPRLTAGMRALDAVALAASLLEDDPLYNAGKGSKIQSDGKIRMSAAIMDGERRRFAGCVNVEGVKNPIHLAKALMKTKDRVLSGEGARRYAKELGLPFASPYTEKSRKEYESRAQGKTGTIGAIAVDSKGRLAAATSTGGRGFEYPHRVSDSPTTAGNFANEVCAVSATGTGEQIVEFSAASTICAYVETGTSLDKAVDTLLGKAREFKGDFGVIAVDAQGRFKVATNTKTIIWAAATPSGFVFLDEYN
ncbi:MAG: isoaspartyl peptidase/L-asparaginase [Bdellovibrionales bacterium]